MHDSHVELSCGTAAPEPGFLPARFGYCASTNGVRFTWIQSLRDTRPHMIGAYIASRLARVNLTNGLSSRFRLATRRSVRDRTYSTTSICCN